MKTAAGAFLGGAASRLLPLSIPFRYFGAALVYHLLAWLALLAGAAEFSHFAGGLGWPLAALHLVTLGVLVMTAIGASLQLLPVATRQSLPSTFWPKLIWWLYTPGVAALTLGMGRGSPALLGAGGLAIALALLVYALLLARNLAPARGMPGVVAHGWAALGCLLALLATAASLVLSYLGLPLLDRATALALHISLAGYGFMGLLALGMSYILVPMFALSAAPEERRILLSCALAVLALALAALAAFGVAPLALRLLAIALGTGAVLLHLQLMRQALRGGMRRAHGADFVLIRVAWGALLASLGGALALVCAAPLDMLAQLFVLALVGGWLLSFLLGMLRRILPFLAAMHAARGSRRPPTASSLSAQRPLALHFACHLLALALLVLALLLDSTLLVRLAAVVGALGAGAFGLFFVLLLARLHGSGSARAAASRAAP